MKKFKETKVKDLKRFIDVSLEDIRKFINPNIPRKYTNVEDYIRYEILKCSSTDRIIIEENVKFPIKIEVWETYPKYTYPTKDKVVDGKFELLKTDNYDDGYVEAYIEIGYLYPNSKGYAIIRKSYSNRYEFTIFCENDCSIFYEMMKEHNRYINKLIKKYKEKVKDIKLAKLKEIVDPKKLINTINNIRYYITYEIEEYTEDNNQIPQLTEKYDIKIFLDKNFEVILITKNGYSYYLYTSDKDEIKSFYMKIGNNVYTYKKIEKHRGDWNDGLFEIWIDVKETNEENKILFEVVLNILSKRNVKYLGDIDENRNKLKRKIPNLKKIEGLANSI